MPPKLPPPAKKGSKSQNAALNSIFARYPGLRQYAPMIRQAAQRWGFDPVFLAATLAIEDGSGNPNARNPSGATGLAQILDKQVNPGYNRQGKFLAQYGQRFQNGKDMATNAEWAINYMAWRMAGHYRQYGTLANAYDKGYNPGYGKIDKGHGPEDLVPTWYYAQAKTSSPADTAGKSVDTTLASQQLKIAAGIAFEQRFPDISSIWEAYTGKPATRAQAYGVYKAGWSNYHLELQLSKGKKFTGSPVWKSKAPGYKSVFEDMYGQNAKAPQQLLAYAIIHNLDGSGFQALLRQRKDYVKSNEFKSNVSGLQDVYQKIYGSPDQIGQNTIKRAALGGWDANEFARYLRAQPEYSKSQEFQSNALGVLDTLGLVTGTGVTLAQGVIPKPYASPVQVAAPPPDKRIPGQSGISTPGPSYTPTLSG